MSKIYGGIFDFDLKSEKLEQVNAELEDPKVWEDPKRAQDLGKEKKSLEAIVESLTAIHADAAVLKALANKEYPKIKPSVNAISDLSKHLMNLVGDMLNSLKLGVLHELGLEEALKDLLNTWQLRYPKINLHYQINLKALPRINETISITSYRIIQECLTNITRHAKAKNVDIHINYIKKNKSIAMINIEVIDDGVGFNKSHRDGFGLSGMRERIYEIDGKINITSNINQGVQFNIQLPVIRKK